MHTCPSRSVGLSILSIRFAVGLAIGVIETENFRIFQFYRSDSLLRLVKMSPADVEEFLSILSIRFRALDPPSLSIRFRLRIGLTQGFISFYLGDLPALPRGFLKGVM